MDEIVKQFLSINLQTHFSSYFQILIVYFILIHKFLCFTMKFILILITFLSRFVHSVNIGYHIIFVINYVCSQEFSNLIKVFIILIIISAINYYYRLYLYSHI